MKNITNSKYIFLFFIFSSWLFFPLMIKPVAPELTIGLFTLSIFACLFSINLNQKINTYKFTSSFLFIIILYLIYLIGLFLSTLNSGDYLGLNSFIVLLTKVLFLIFILCFLNYNLIVKINNLYSNIIFIVSLFSIISFIYIELGFPALYSFELNGVQTDLYILTYQYHSATPIFNIAGRLQGLVEEGGTFAMVILPAFFWQIFVRGQKLYILVLALALVLTMSFGALIFLLIFLFYCQGNKNLKLYFLGIFSLMILLYSLSTQTDVPTTVTWSGKVFSFVERFNGVLASFEYLLENFYGAGSSLGMSTINNSIAVGYIIAMVDSGLLAGVAYCLVFLSLSFLAIGKIKSIKRNSDSKNSSIDLCICFSLLAILFMALQRMQPDQSFWHMLYIAMFLFIRFNNNARLGHSH